MKISVVTPLYKSAPYIEELYQRSVAAIAATGASAHEFIFVNDGSPDNSLALAREIASRDLNVVVIDLSRNFGQHQALMTGLRYATGDFVFVMDSDLDEKPEWINIFYLELLARGCDVVYGITGQNTDRPIYGIGRRFFYGMLNILSGVDFPINITNARIMTKRFVDALLLFKEREIYLGGLWHITGFTQLAIDVEKTNSSPSSYSLRRLFGLVVNAVTGFSTRPLIAISLVGLAVAFVGLALMAWVLVLNVFYGTSVPGWLSLMIVVLMLGSLQLVVTGIVAVNRPVDQADDPKAH